MHKIVIVGGTRLSGEVVISGAKNAALPLLTSALLATGPSTFRNMPLLQDVRIMGRLLEQLGCSVQGERRIVVTPPEPGSEQLEAPYDLVRKMRASILVLGPLVARYGRARVSLPGGCAIGARPIDQHLRGLKAMGATVNLSHGYVDVRAKQLRGAHIVCDVPSVTGTENLMMAATLAKGTTVIENAAREPEIEDLAVALNNMGGNISGAGTTELTICGVEELTSVDHYIVPDRIEAGTFMVAAALTKGNILIKGARPEHLDAVLAKLRTCGVTVQAEPEGLRINHTGGLGPVDITTQPHPGFPTDMQAQFMVLTALASGQSVIKEAIFENRFMHVPELRRMGADIRADGRVAVIRGIHHLSAATVMATDLRASASLVLAGLVADGVTEVLRVYHLDRGYEQIENKLRQLGAQIQRIQT